MTGLGQDVERYCIRSSATTAPDPTQPNWLRFSLARLSAECKLAAGDRGSRVIVRPGCTQDAECLQSVAQAAGLDASVDTFLRDLDNPEIAFFVAEIDSTAVGFLALRSTPSPAFVPSRSPLQLWRLYIHPNFHGKGVARSLTGRALIHAHGRDHDVVWLGTEAGNARAIAFYGKCGFVVAGKENLHGDGTSPDVIMTCWL